MMHPAASPPLPAPAPAPAGGSTAPGGGGGGKKPLSLMVGDQVHFAVQDGRGTGPARHGSVVLFVDGDRALLASSSTVPNVKVIEVDGDKVGMSWVKTAYLGKGHKHCQTALDLNLDAAWGLRSKILLTAGDLNETSVLSARGSATNTSDCSLNNSELQSPNVPASPAPESALPHDRELRAMVKEALQGFNSKDQMGSGSASGQTESTQAGSSRPPPRNLGSPGDSTMARELKAVIAEAFDEGIQTFRAEQKNMDRWVGMLQERVSKVTGHFLTSWGSRLESEMDRRLTIYDESIKSTCAQLLQQGNPGVAQAPRPVTGPGLGAPAITHNQVQPAFERAGGDADADPQSNHDVTAQGASNPNSPAKRELSRDSRDKSKDTSKQVGSTNPTVASAGQGTMSASANAQTLVMIEKIKKDREHSAAVKQAIESSCACYHQDCMPAGFRAFVHSPIFNYFCGVMSLLFAVMVGIEVHLDIVAELDEEESPAWPSNAIRIFNAVFAAEVAVRMIADGVVFFVGPDWRWNLFDLVLVVFSILDILLSTGTVGFWRLLRAINGMKSLRVVRIVGLFSDLRAMVTQMVHSLGTLLWSMVFLLVIVYVCAVAFMQAATIYIKDESRTNAVAQGVRELYDNLPDAMYTMFLCITGGIEWRHAAEPIWALGRVYGSLFVGFIVVSILGIFNVVTSVFVERATTMKRLDRDYAFLEELRIMETDVEDTIGLFKVLDPEGKNNIRVQDVQKFLKNDRIIAHFAAMGVDITDTTKYSNLLQEGDSGVLNIDSFVLGCMSLRGPVKQSETLSIILAVRKLESSLHYVRTNVASDVDSAVRRMTRLMASNGPGATPAITGLNAAPHNEGPMSMPANRVANSNPSRELSDPNQAYRTAAGITYGPRPGSTDV